MGCLQSCFSLIKTQGTLTNPGNVIILKLICRSQRICSYELISCPFFSRENRDEDVKKNLKCNNERQSKKCGHQKGARNE